jgi:hypothetical protein
VMRACDIFLVVLYRSIFTEEQQQDKVAIYIGELNLVTGIWGFILGCNLESYAPRRGPI